MELSESQQQLLVTIADSVALYYARGSTAEEQRDLEVLHEFGYITETRKRQYKLLVRAVVYLFDHDLRPQILQAIFDFFEETKEQDRQEWNATEIDEFCTNHQLEEKILYWAFWIAEGLRFVQASTGLGRLLPFFIRIKPLGLDFSQYPENYIRIRTRTQTEIQTEAEVENNEPTLQTITETVFEIREILRTPQSRRAWIETILIGTWISFLGGIFSLIFVNFFQLEEAFYLFSVLSLVILALISILFIILKLSNR